MSLCPPGWKDIVSMDEPMAAAAIDLLIDRDQSMRQKLGPLIALAGLLK